MCLNDCFSIQDASADAVVTWEWDFGSAFEPSSSTLQNPEVCATEPGTYSITLKGITGTGAASVHSKEIIVHENPMLEASADTIIELGGTANLMVSSSSAGEFLWSPPNEVNCPECEVTFASPCLLYTSDAADD